ncbi:MAG: hypothetical protein AAF555_05775 [Verrucomicrobiota bacterium]
MDIYELAIAKSTPKQAAQLVKEMAAESEKYRKAITDALMQLETNYDVNGNSMKDSDAARCLRASL